MKKLVLFLGIAITVLHGCKDNNSDVEPKKDNEEPTTDVPEYYLPSTKKFIGWDFPNIAHTGIDIDYKLTGYDYFNRDLAWSVTKGPDGMTIDADGTLHWTPGEEGTYEVSVALSLGGQEELTKDFTITVDNSKCIFIAPNGSNETGDGSIDKPFAVFGEKIAEIIIKLNGGCTVYNRGGEYTADFIWSSFDFPKMKKLPHTSFAKDNPLTIRNYPKEKPVYNIVRNGFRLYGNYCIVMGIEIAGGTGSEAGGLVLGGRSVAKKMYVHDYNTIYDGNCAGVKVSGDVILDQVIAANNYDRGNTEHHNSSNFLFYGAKDGTTLTGNAYFIDCLSMGYSVCGFKIKHAGTITTLHMHKCASIETLKPWAGAQNLVTIRHSHFINSKDSKSAAVGLSVTDPDTNGEINLEEGMLIEKNLIINSSPSGFAMSQWSYVMNADPETPAYWKNNIIETHSTEKGNMFVAADNSNEPVPDTWNLKFEGNKVYSTSTDNAFILNGEVGDLAKLFSYGNDNEQITQTGTYNFTAAGKTFTVSNGAVSE